MLENRVEALELQIAHINNMLKQVITVHNSMIDDLHNLANQLMELIDDAERTS